MLNVHPSLIPRWRGAAPIERAIMAGDERTGVDDHAASPRASTRGRSRSRRSSPSAEPRTTSRCRAAGGAERRAAGRGPRPAGGGRARASPSRTRRRRPTRRRSRRRSATSTPSRPAAELERAVRALSPHIGAYLELEGRERLGVRAARAAPDGPPPGRSTRTRSVCCSAAARGPSRLRARPAARRQADGGGGVPARPRARPAARS